jgi:predicted acylesterase/phospholipase RssA
MVTRPASSKPFQAVSFSGCGTLNFYQTGVAASLQRAQLVEGMSFAGASAGSGLATLIAAGVDAEHICDKAIDILAPVAGKNILARPDIPIAFASRFLRAFVDDDILSRIGDRVHISITAVAPLRNWKVNRFHDVQDLCRAIRASCHIPSWRRRSVRFRGHACMDGGFTSNTPIVSERCLTVSPFSLGRNVDLAPNRALNPLRAVVIPDRRRARALFERGVADADNYLERLQQGAVALRPKSSKPAVAAGRELPAQAPSGTLFPAADLPA